MHFAGPSPYPTYILPPMKKLTPLPTALPFAAPTCGLTPSLSNKQQYSPPNAQYVPSLPSLPSFNLPPRDSLFEDMVRKDFASPCPYPTYILPPMKKSTPPPSALLFAAPTCGLTPTVHALIALTALIQLAPRDSLFKDMVRKGFAGPGPYPTYILPPTKKSTPPPSALLFAAPTCGLTPSPSNEQ